MKFNVNRRVHYDAGPNLTPLVDIVLVILIFLMLAGNFGWSEHYLVSNVPVEAKGAAPPPPGAAIPTRFTINVQQDGPYYIAQAGNFASVKSTDPAKAREQLAADLTSQRKSLNDAGVKTDDIQVIISPTASVVLDSIVPVMEAAQDAGFTKIGFKVGQ